MLIDYFVEEIDKVELCTECYTNARSNPDSWLSMPCIKPHLIIWTKVRRDTNYWPAKLMSVDEQQMVNVHLFGCHVRIKVPADQCLLYSKTNPSEDRITSTPYASALKVSPPSIQI